MNAVSTIRTAPRERSWSAKWATRLIGSTIDRLVELSPGAVLVIK
jgi:hypothetical protein